MRRGGWGVQAGAGAAKRNQTLAPGLPLALGLLAGNLERRCGIGLGIEIAIDPVAQPRLHAIGDARVDPIEGLSPAISIEQKTTSRKPRSTVATVAEIYEYMRLLWARAEVPYSPATALPIAARTVSQMIDRVIALAERPRALAAGTVLTADDLVLLRPATGIPPKALDAVPGRTLRGAVAAGDPISWDMLV